MQINPNTLEIVLVRSLTAITTPMREEIQQLRGEVKRLREQQSALLEQQATLVAAFEQMQRNHTEQLKMLAESLQQPLADSSSE